MYKRILVPLDGSGLAECVFEHVKEVAKGCEAAEVDLLYVVRPFNAPFEEFSQLGDLAAYPAGDVREFGAERYEHWGRDYLEDVSKAFAKEGIPTRSVILRGDPDNVILNYVRDNAVDLVIMATHGRSGVQKWSLGSTADRVLRNSIAPVMIVRPQECQVTL